MKRRLAPPRLGYRPELDGLRCFAVLAVVVTHAIETLSPGWPPVLHGGFLGVDLFFVLSGFLITTLLLEERDRTGDVSIRRFYARRGLRLLPALYALIAVQLVVAVALKVPVRREAQSLAFVVCYVANWAFSTGFQFAPGLAHCWSLSMEEQFYLVWPWLFRGVIGNSRSWRATPWILGGLVVVVGIARAAVWAATGSWRSIYTRTDLRADALLVGVMLALLWRGVTFGPRFAVIGQVLGGLVLGGGFLFLNVTTPALYQGGFVVAALASAALVLGTLEAPAPSRVLCYPLIQWIGKRSYGVYLWHYTVMDTVSRAFGLLDANGIPRPALSRHVALWVALVLVMTFAATAMSYRCIERPSLRHKIRFQPVGANQAVDSGNRAKVM